MPGIDDKLPVARGPLALLLTIAFFVSPLLFFTDLTRNPYYLQITLLNISLLGAAALFIGGSLKRGKWLLPRTPLSRPMAALLVVYALSFANSLFCHAEFFRSAIISEGLRAGIFFLVNCALVFFLALSLPYSSGRDAEVPVGRWLALILVWGGLWFLFPWLKAPSAGVSVAQKILDPYGSLLWLSGITAVYFLIKRCRQEDVLHLALSVGAIASLYGVLEYFHIEFIWAKLINPYGNRSVSTFGNPNFISSFVVVLLPLAAWHLVKAETTIKRFYYGLLFLSYEGMLMASLTRSSWLGAALTLIFLFSFAPVRRKFLENKTFLIPFFTAALTLLVLWPSQALAASGGVWFIIFALLFLSTLRVVRTNFFAGGKLPAAVCAALFFLALWRPVPLTNSGFWDLRSALFERVSEVSDKINSVAALSLSEDKEKMYSSFHQRLLIWTSAWQMGLENPLLGKGWGQFELFYPFYQGRLLLNFPEVRGLRTHANNAHNEILEQWAQTGLLGLGIYLWFFVTLFFGFFRFYRAAAPDAGAEALPLAAGLCGMLLDNFLNVSLHFAVPALAFWWVAGALALKNGAGAQPQAQAQWRHPRAAAAAAWLLIFCCLAGAWFWQRQFKRELLYFSGFKAMRSNNFSVAAAELQRAWGAHSREVNNNYEMGNAYVRTGDLEKGVWGYLEALKSNSGYDEIYFNLAIVLKRLNRLPEALKYLQVSSFINPFNQAAWQVKAEIYLALPDKEARARAATEDFKEAVKAFSNDGNMWNTLGYFYTLDRDYKAAYAAYALGVKTAPDNNMLRGNLSDVSRRLGLKNDPALYWLTQYLALEQAVNAPAPDPSALKAAEALLALDPANIKARALRAKFYFKANRLAEARADLQAVLKVNGADNSVRYGLAVIYEKERNFPAARLEWGRFLALEPGNAVIAQRLKALP